MSQDDDSIRGTTTEETKRLAKQRKAQEPRRKALEVATQTDPNRGILTSNEITPLPDEPKLEGRQKQLMEEWVDEEVAQERAGRVRKGKVQEPNVPEDATNKEAMAIYESVGMCGSRRKGYKTTGQRCTQPAGFGTSHYGYGRCKYHGGKHTTANRTNDAYSNTRQLRIRQLYEEFRDDPDPLNMLGEVAMLRALTRDYIERFDQDKESRELWLAAVKNRSARDDEVRHAVNLLLQVGTPPTQIMDLSDAWRLLAECTKAVKRIEDVRAQNAISRQDLFRVLREMGRSVRRHNDEPNPEKRLKKIEAEWERIAL